MIKSDLDSKQMIGVADCVQRNQTDNISSDILSELPQHLTS